MTDQRPRPQYGEYATPEQQAAAMGQPASQPAPQLPVTSAPPPYRQRPIAVVAPSRRWNVLASFLLLAWGLYSVISGLFQYSDLGGFIDQVYRMQGIGRFTSTQLATTLGIVINVSNVVLYLLTVFLTIRLLRRGRPAFYVPLIGGIVAGIVGAVCLAVLMLGDPAFIAYVNGAK